MPRKDNQQNICQLLQELTHVKLHHLFTINSQRICWICWICPIYSGNPFCRMCPDNIQNWKMLCNGRCEKTFSNLIFLSSFVRQRGKVKKNHRPLRLSVNLIDINVPSIEFESFLTWKFVQLRVCYIQNIVISWMPDANLVCFISPGLSNSKLNVLVVMKTLTC